MANRINAAELDLQEQLVVLNRVSKTVKGGRIARFAKGDLLTVLITLLNFGLKINSV